jgi:hypothetical protein
VDFVLQFRHFASAVNEVCHDLKTVDIACFKPLTIVEDKSFIFWCNEFLVDICFTTGVFRNMLKG